MAVVNIPSLDVPYQTPISGDKNLITLSWQNFFRKLYDIVNPLGFEKSAQLLNNQASAVNIEGMQFDFDKVNQVTIEYIIHRITTGGGATEIVTTGIMQLAYRKVSLGWSIVPIGTPGPSVSGITFTITASGQVQYTSSNITGTASISKITYRARTLNAKVGA